MFKRSLMECKRLLLLALVTIVLLIALLPAPLPVQAHANLSRSEPSPNTLLAEAPAEIRLSFTEPLEAEFSRITLRDQSGAEVETPPAQVDPADPMQLVLIPGALSDGLYTVVWRVVSAADGHMTAGSFPIGVGNVTFDVAALAPAADESVSPVSVVVRWFNFISAALLLGALGFWLFVWQPSGIESAEGARRLSRLMWLGWRVSAAALALMLLLQTSVASDTSLLSALNLTLLTRVIGGTRFGILWVLGVLAWWLAGGMLFVAGAKRDRLALSTALVFGAGVLLTTSLFSHASAAADQYAAIAGDWLHYVSMALWVGGLVAFARVIGPTRRMAAVGAAQNVGRLVTNFSNYVRVTVAALILSGVYSAWLQIGSLNGLLTTVYGRALLVKLVLILPLLVIAGVNLLYTSRRLRQGDAAWVGRLRGLIGVEIALLAGVLLAVAVMTSGTPARGVLAIREAEAPPVPETTITEMQMTPDLMAHLEITPGTVGENTFRVELTDMADTPITDASRIRMRFTSLEQDLGQSELRPELQDDGSYAITGANLSIPGAWRIRMTVARPGEFDTVLDFEPQINLPTPPPAPIIDQTIPAFNRLIAVLLTGMALVAVGGFFVAANGLRWRGGGDWVALALVGVGAVFLVTAATSVDALERRTEAVTAVDAWMIPSVEGMDGSVYLSMENATENDDSLIDAETDLAEAVSFHLTQVRDDIARMRQVDDLDIASGSTLTLAPGGYHLMLEGLRRDLTAGETFPLTLRFASGTEIELTVAVREE
ncbi:MAG: copper chaperone PCu(A)C [bacterium]|nr:copper chaperone PCu(A)C [bacterium]